MLERYLKSNLPEITWNKPKRFSTFYYIPLFVFPNVQMQRILLEKKLTPLHCTFHFDNNKADSVSCNSFDYYFCLRVETCNYLSHYVISARNMCEDAGQEKRSFSPTFRTMATTTKSTLTIELLLVLTQNFASKKMFCILLFVYS